MHLLPGHEKLPAHGRVVALPEALGIVTNVALG